MHGLELHGNDLKITARCSRCGMWSDHGQAEMVMDIYVMIDTMPPVTTFMATCKNNQLCAERQIRNASRH